MPSFELVHLPGQQPALLEPDGHAVWITEALRRNPVVLKNCLLYQIVKRSWNPASGTYTDSLIGLEAEAASDSLATPSGILFFLPTHCPGRSSQIGLLRQDGKAVTVPVSRHYIFSRQVLLSDGAVAVLTTDDKTRHLQVDIVRLLPDGSLSVTPLPELPIPTRRDFREAALPDGRLMVLGGSDASYRGCSPCRAETHILDPKISSWSAGPAMLEPRSEHLATSLPDGSILVTGGWTPTQGWGHGPSRTAERWNPATNKFEAIAPMPSGTSRHMAVWMPGQQGKILLIAGGTSSSIHAYDVRNGAWSMPGITRQGSEEGGCVFVPFLRAGRVYAWSGYKSEGHYSSQSCATQNEWQLTALRIANGTLASAGADASVTYRSDAAVIPAHGDRPALIVGGALHAGMNSYLVTGAVESIDKYGQSRALPSLLEARRGASAFRIGGGVLVLGGQGEDSNARSAARPLPMEWLASDAPDSKARWEKVPGPDRDRVAALGQFADGNLLAIDVSGNVHRYVLNTSDHPPSIRIDNNAIPRLNRARLTVAYDTTGMVRALSDNRDDRTIRIRELADGRIVVAGGYVQRKKIARLHDDTQQPGAADEDIGVDEFLPSHSHEIYEPSTGRWRTSAPSRGAGGKAAILPDGRVVKIGKLAANNEREANFILEVSSAGGTEWSALPGEPTAIKLSDTSAPFVVEDELFLAGELRTLSTGGGPGGVEWYNSATGKWEVLWQAKPGDNWRDHLGRLIVRQLANGKTVVLPINGL